MTHMLGIRCKWAIILDCDPLEKALMIEVPRLFTSWLNGCIGLLSTGMNGFGVHFRVETGLVKQIGGLLGVLLSRPW